MDDFESAPAPNRRKLRLSKDRSFLLLGTLQIGVGVLNLLLHTHHQWLIGSTWLLIGLTSLFRSKPDATGRDPFAPISLFNGNIPR